MLNKYERHAAGQLKRFVVATQEKGLKVVFAESFEEMKEVIEAHGLTIKKYRIDKA